MHCALKEKNAMAKGSYNYVYKDNQITVMKTLYGYQSILNGRVFWSVYEDTCKEKMNSFIDGLENSEKSFKKRKSFEEALKNDRRQRNYKGN
jgi:hypothetical protein